MDVAELSGLLAGKLPGWMWRWLARCLAGCGWQLHGKLPAWRTPQQAQPGHYFPEKRKKRKKIKF